MTDHDYDCKDVYILVLLYYCILGFIVLFKMIYVVKVFLHAISISLFPKTCLDEATNIILWLFYIFFQAKRWAYMFASSFD